MWKCLSAFLVMLICYMIFFLHGSDGNVTTDSNGSGGKGGRKVLKTPLVSDLLNKMNKELRIYRHVGAEMAWILSTNMSQEALEANEDFSIRRNTWSNGWCSKLTELYYLDRENPNAIQFTPEQLRQLYLLCRGPKFTSYQLSNILSILGTLQRSYNKEICFDQQDCFRVEPDLNRIMESSRDPQTLETVWVGWHRHIGRDLKTSYVSLIQMMNEGARQAGHRDMGECWREETEVPELRKVVLQLYWEVKHLYQILHTFVRFKLEKFYGTNFHGGQIPSHLLGNLYAQNWQSLIDIVWEEDDGDFDNEVEGKEKASSSDSQTLVNSILPRNATVMDMVKAAESFFVSMGLPKLPPSFWTNSYFEDNKDDAETKSRNCHGSAANMFGLTGPDYRLMMCAKLTDEDFVTFQHELGHILYFMAYENLPTIFQDGANSAFHEAVGDSVTYDLRPHSSPRINMKSLLRQGLTKIPQVGFGLVMDMWRWRVFETENKPQEWNEVWWKLHQEYLGVKRPPGYEKWGKDSLDALGKFHIIDNIPYVRYFLASFLQLQFYDTMCQAAGYEDIHRCQIRGSKEAGKVLWNMMSKGTSEPWSRILEEMTDGKVREISSTSFLKYFKPLKHWLEGKVRKYNLTVGW